MNSFRSIKIKVLQKAVVSEARQPPLFAFPGSADKKTMTKRAVFVGLGGLLLLHCFAIFLSRQSEGVSALFVLACSLSAAAACYRRSTGAYGPVRRKWDFLASALSLWSIGEAIHAFRLLTPHLNHRAAIGPEFYFLVYGIPVLLAISTSNEERDTVLFVLIDSFQAVFAVVLVYVELSLAQATPEPASGRALIYGIGAWILAGAASLRVLARPWGEERTLYRILVVYLGLFAVLATPWHGICVLNALPIGLYRDLASDLPFLLLAAGCLLVKPNLREQPERAPVETNSFALVLNNGSPILFTLAVLALGAMVARHNFTLGISAIGLCLLIYCFRAALLQSAYIHAQHALTRSQYALREANARLKQLSLHDALTGLPNRRLFDQTLDLEWNRAMRNSRPLSLLILDVDCFKALNDLRGHPSGDDCLRKVAGALEASLRRAGDVVARYGGEEFAAVLPDCDLSGAIVIAESMRASVFALAILHEGSTAEKFVTISVGAATMLPAGDNSAISLIAAADDALYRAKRAGRNRVEHNDPAAVAVEQS